MTRDCKRRNYLDRLERLKSDRSSWESHWQEISDFILPRRGRIGEAVWANRGGRKGQRIVDATATRAMRALAAGLQSGLTSPSRPWFRLGLKDESQARPARVRKWLHEVETIMMSSLARSGFYQAVHGLYLELAAFGTGVLYCAEGARAPLHFRCLTAGEYYLATDHEGMVDTVYRVFTLPARAMEQRFGRKNLSETVRLALEKNRDECFEILHAVQPRGEFDPVRRDAKGMPFESVFMEMRGNHDGLLLETGYMEQPYMCPRWDTTGSEVFGRSPGMDVLPDVMMLQEMSKSQVMAIHKVLNPPMRVPAMYSKRLNLLPGAQNQVEQNQQDAVAPLYQINPDIRSVSAKIEDVRQAIRQGLYNDLFLMVADDKRANVTAAEVMEKHEEKLLQLGPVVERQQSELLDPLLNRVYGVLSRSGELPPPPANLAKADFHIEYVSVLAQAQRMSGLEAIRKTSDFIRQAALLDPAILEKFNVDQAVEEHARLVGLPPNLLFSQEEIEKRREENLARKLEGAAGPARGGADIPNAMRGAAAGIPGQVPGNAASLLQGLPSAGSSGDLAGAMAGAMSGAPGPNASPMAGGGGLSSLLAPLMAGGAGPGGLVSLLAGGGGLASLKNGLALGGETGRMLGDILAKAGLDLPGLAALVKDALGGRANDDTRARLAELGEGVKAALSTARAQQAVPKPQPGPPGGVKSAGKAA